MAKELEILWQKLKVTDEEEVNVNLGRECTRATKERGGKLSSYEGALSQRYYV